MIRIIQLAFLLAFLTSCNVLKPTHTNKNSLASTARNTKRKTFLFEEAPIKNKVLTKWYTKELAAQELKNYSKEYFGNSIENLNSFQFKYGIILDVAVERISNIKLYKFIDEWIGTPYRMGRTGDGAIDCSAFSQKLLEDVFGTAVSRTVKTQYKELEKITTDDLLEGDLVFFHTYAAGASHVGVYLKNNKFVHASSSRGVMISSLDDSYWRPRYVGARRVN
jgi:cell wall-associated NlpC family hydrolase